MSASPAESGHPARPRLVLRTAVGRIQGRNLCRRGPLAASSHRPLCARPEYSRHSHDVAGRHRQLEVLIDLLDASIQCLPDPTDCLAPAEVLFDAFADRLADGIALMSCRAPVDGAATDARVIDRDMRCDAALAAIGDEVARVIGLVCPDRLGMPARQRIQHGQRRRPLAQAVRMHRH